MFHNEQGFLYARGLIRAGYADSEIGEVLGRDEDDEDEDGWGYDEFYDSQVNMATPFDLHHLLAMLDKRVTFWKPPSKKKKLRSKKKKRKNPDEDLRSLWRKAQAGDQEAAFTLEVRRARATGRCPCEGGCPPEFWESHARAEVERDFEDHGHYRASSP